MGTLNVPGSHEFWCSKLCPIALVAILCGFITPTHFNSHSSQPLTTSADQEKLHYQIWRPHKARRLFLSQSCKGREKWPTQATLEYARVKKHVTKKIWLLEWEYIHGPPTPYATSYVARSIPPVFSHMGVRVALLTVTTMCNFERGGAMKPIIG